MEADYLRMLLTKANYAVCEIARSVPEALVKIKSENSDLIFLDIFLKENSPALIWQNY